MAEQYSMLGQPKKSLECALNVLKINEKTNSPEENHWIYWRISGNYNTLKEYNLAFKYDSLCLEAAKKTNEIILISNAYANFANTFEDAGKYKEAEFYQYKSWTIYTKRYRTCNTNTTLICLHIFRHDYDNYCSISPGK